MKIWIKSIVFILIIFNFSAFAKIDLEPKTEEEAFFIRRIIEYFQEEEFGLFEREIQEFLVQYPESTLKDNLLALLSDYFMKEKRYEEAIEKYEKIKTHEIKQKIVLNYLQALYYTKSYDLLISIAEPFLDYFSESDLEKHHQIRFLHADSFYRKSLDTSLSNELRVEHAKRAINLLEDLTSSDISLDAMRSLAHLYYLTKQFSKSAHLYLELAEKDPEHKERMLFKAGTVQIHFDKTKAAETFTQICHIGKAYAPSAAYNRMILLFELKQHPELILAKDQLLRSLDKDKIPLLYFFLGQSHIARADPKRGIIELKNFLSNSTKFQEQEKIALLSLSEIANDTEDVDLFDECLPKLDSFAELDSKVYEVYFAHALVCKKKKMYAKAKHDFEKLLKFSASNEKILFEYAHLLYLIEDFNGCREHFQTLITKYPESPSILTSIRFFIQMSLKLANDPNEKFSKQDLAADLKNINEKIFGLNKKELQNYQFLLAKTQYEMKNYEDAIVNAKNLLKQNLPKKLLKEAYLLIGYCFRDGPLDHLKFCSYAERALQIDSSPKKKGKIHKALFNSYAKLGFDKYKEKGADNLYKAIEAGEIAQKENLLWLADYYYKQNDISKTIFIYEKAFPLEDIHTFALTHEEELIKLSKLYLLSYQDKKNYNLLDKLEKEYLKAPFEKWKYSKEVRFNLAKQLEKENDFVKAVIYYEEVIKNSSSLRDYPAAKSTLQAARLRLQNIPKNQFNKQNPVVVKILEQFKNLTIQKTLQNEPIHFEAGFEYIDLLCGLEDKLSRNKKRLLLLEKMRNDFSSNETVIDREYHETRKDNPDIDKLYYKYMEVLDSEILLSKALIQGENDQTLRAKAHLAFKALKNDPSLNSFLIERVENNLKTFQSSN